MKKIGILTFHNAYNFGAVLQAYALKEYLQKNSNCTVEIVNYKNEQIEKEKSRWKSLFNNNVIKELARNLLTTPYYLKLDKVFSKFVNKYLTADNEIKKEDLSSLKYDLYLVGSDQVWNITLTGNDKTFFCDFAMPESICCSYAASIGSSAFSNEELQNYKQLIDRFALISFREKELVPIFEKIASEKKICSVVDPVFLLKQDEWNTMASSIVRKPYVLFFCVGYNDELDQTLEFAKNLANEKNMELLYLSNQDIWYKHRELHHCGAASPCEFLGYIRNASYVVTNSFHATAFSIIFHREFYSEIGLKRNGRIKNILNLTGLQDHAINRGINKENTFKGNLYTVDLICHGVPSPRVYNSYLHYLERKMKSKIKEFIFRDKIGGVAQARGKNNI